MRRSLPSGWRLACQCALEDDLVIELRQWDAAILVDETPFAFEPRAGLGVAVDLGTTTLVTQLLDLRTGRVLAVRTALNSQARFGADVMSRVRFAVAEGGARQLRDLIRQQIGSLIEQLVFAAQVPEEEITDVVVVGNTVMHHLFCGLDVEPLIAVPFRVGAARPPDFPRRGFGVEALRRGARAFSPLPGRVRGQRYSGRHSGHEPQ